MAVVLLLVVLALALPLYLWNRPPQTGAGFGPILRCCLLLPAIAIFICVGIAFSHVLPPRSPWIAAILLIVLGMTLVEIIAFTAAVVRLIQMPGLRSHRNVATAVVGGLGLLPALGLALTAAIVNRYAG